MTPEQLEVIALSLPEIKAHEDLFAAAFYEGCFALWPEARTLARGDVTRRGRMLVDEFLTLSTASIRDMDGFVDHAHTLGVRHRELGAHREHYEAVERALNHALATVLGDRFDTPTAHAWHRLYCLMYETMLEGAASKAFSAPAPPGARRPADHAL